MPERKIIAVGYAPGELLPPYRNKREEQEAKKILRYVQDKNVVFTPIAIHPGNYKKYFGEQNFPREVEIVGSWLEMCVAETINFCLEVGSEVLADPRYIISYHGRKNNKSKAVFLKENLIIPQMYQRSFKGTPEGILFKQDRLFLFNDIKERA